MTKNWWKAALIRCIRTIAQCAISGIGVAVVLSEVDWIYVVSASILAGILSILMSLSGLPEVKEDEPTPLAELPIDQYELSYRESADSMTELVNRFKDRLTAEPTEEMLRRCASELYDFYDDADSELFEVRCNKGGWADSNNTLDRYRKMLYVTYTDRTAELTAFYEELISNMGSATL